MPGMQKARVMVACRGLHLTYSYVDTVVDTVEDDEDDTQVGRLSVAWRRLEPDVRDLPSERRAPARHAVHGQDFGSQLVRTDLPYGVRQNVRAGQLLDQ